MIKLNIGDKFNLCYYPGNINNADIEIRAIIDWDHVVYTKNGIYRISNKYLFQEYFKNNYLTKINKKENNNE